LTNSRATSCATAMLSLAMTSENGCETWASAKFSLRRAHLGSEPMSSGSSIRRECLDHVIVFDETSLRRTLNSYFDYYHRSRTHLSLGKDSPEPRRFSRPKWGLSWQCRRSVGCIAATNDGLPEKPQGTRLRAASPGALKSVSGLCSLARPCLGGFHSPDSSWAGNFSGFAVRLGNGMRSRLHGIFVRDNSPLLGYLVQQFHAGFTRGLAESHIQGCQRQFGSKRQV
jgi:hypothetical protein